VVKFAGVCADLRAVSFFDDLGSDDPLPPLPTRVYARIDETSTDRVDQRTLFDVVDADWLDELGDQPGLLVDPEIELEARSHVSMLVIDEHTTRASEGRVAEIRLGPQHPEGAADHYQTLTSAAVRRRVESVNWKTGSESRRLAAFGKLDAIDDASPQEIREALDVGGEVSAVAVYDVGQGLCTAAIVDDCAAVFFDVGAGSDANASTFPSAFDRLCLCADPTVVLSHFHHDHWAAVGRFPMLLSQTWIVPRQGPTLGFIHAVLAGAIRRCGRLLIWPRREDRLCGGNAIEVLRCGGKARNDSGLAMVVHGGNDDGKVLLPGDARYRHVNLMPHLARSLVVAHHGGRTNAQIQEVPKRDKSPAGRLVYSYGPCNTYEHPLPGPFRTHEQVWGPDYLATADRALDGQLGHVHLYWDQQAPAVRASCALSTAQRPCQR
jgi:beta-lactamase superfamily II metal-dependent hydrolase